MISSRLASVGFCFSLAVAAPAAAQLSSSGASSTGASGPLSRDQSETAVTEFAGLHVEVRRVLATGETGHYRVVANVTDVSGSEDWRHAAWMLTFPPTLIDDMGNEYVTISVRGAIGTCETARYSESAGGCWSRQSTRFTELPAATPAVTVIDFAPSDEHAIPELMAAASTVDFAARIAVNPGENGEPSAADLVINRLALPR